MSEEITADVIRRYNDVFQKRDVDALDDLIGEGCVIENTDGQRVEGRAAAIAWWRAIAENRAAHFDLEDVHIAGDRAVIRWRYVHDGGSTRGVNLMLVRDGRIVEGLGYAKTT
ncbi:nuclear transport factor 2 family protein [Longispora sp. NPDC051575]|uniref:nuclear transport factor 2 family protein n=1 Tax=Longispora sp. NPDC051575 TaxID=3154943 RepID=UPI0034488B86